MRINAEGRAFSGPFGVFADSLPDSWGQMLIVADLFVIGGTSRNDSISKTFFPSVAGMMLTVNSLARAPSTRAISASAAALGAARATGGPGWIGAGAVVAAGSMEQMTCDN